MYVLLVFALSFNMSSSDYPTMMSAEFGDRAACDVARLWIEKAVGHKTRAVCLPKSTTTAP